MHFALSFARHLLGTVYYSQARKVLRDIFVSKSLPFYSLKFLEQTRWLYNFQGFFQIALHSPTYILPDSKTDNTYFTNYWKKKCFLENDRVKKLTGLSLWQCQIHSQSSGITNGSSEKGFSECLASKGSQKALYLGTQSKR